MYSDNECTVYSEKDDTMIQTCEGDDIDNIVISVVTVHGQCIVIFITIHTYNFFVMMPHYDI